MMPASTSALLACLAALCVCGASGCGPKDIVWGCKSGEGGCVCGVGCRTEYRYSSKDACKAETKSTKRWDICNSTPCANGGLCTQVQRYYRCRCEGTGFYGPRCQYPCPVPGTTSVKVFPYECVVI